ncbi:MAG: Spore cortex-lytic enzyme [Patescibacteria group bacterium]|nr:Spore cortex-lytic enzyme [Patescibacteria group bacterium]
MKKAIFAVLLLASFSFVSAQGNPPELFMGSQGDEVGSLQSFLGVEPSTWFGAVTESKVKEFQKSKGLPATGVVDCGTRALIKVLAPCTTTKSATTGGATAKLSSADSWYQQNCLPEPVGLEYGRITPAFYTPSGMGGTELAQISKPFNVSATGLSSTTIGAKITASDNQVDIQPASCKEGMPSGGMGCTVTISGEPRELYLKIFNGRPGIKPLCHKVTAYRAPISYKLSLSIDKNQFGSYEAFKVTIGGMTRPELVSAFSNGSGYVNAPFAITREGAPASSCESGSNIAVCQSDGVMNCTLLPGNDSSSPEYMCAVTGLDVSSATRYPNKNGPVKYTLTIRNAYGLFDTYSPATTGGSDAITLLKHGTNGAETSYGNCSAGDGINPSAPQNGCTRCQNISNAYRSRISSCNVTGQDTFKWTYVGQSSQWDQLPSCQSLNATEGAVCNDSSLSCVTGSSKLACKNTSAVVNQSAYHGKVLDENNNPISGVTVQAWSVIGNMMAYATPCPTATTDTSGEYRFSQSESQSLCLSSNGYVRFKKAGYVEESIPAGNEFDKLIKTYTMKPLGGGGNPVNPGTPTTPVDPSALSLSPTQGVMQRTQGHQVAFTLTNGKIARDADNLDVCYEVTKRAVDQFTPTAINKPANPSSCTWILKWKGNSDWQVVGNNLRWTINYGPDWNIPGLQVMMAFRKNNNPSQVTYAVMDIPGSGGGGNTGTPTTPAYRWEVKPVGVLPSPQPPACFSPLPPQGAVCTTLGEQCVSGGNLHTCIDPSKSASPAPKAQGTPNTNTNTNIVTTVVETVTTVVTAVIVDPVIEIVDTVVEVVTGLGKKIKGLINLN